jgi:hypothetical protein
MRLLKYKDLLIEVPERRARVAGHFTLVITKPDGSSRIAADFDNLITDGGLERMGIGTFRNICAVGTGSVAPSVSDVQLNSTRAWTAGGAPNVPGASAQTSPPYYTTNHAGFRFGQGAASGSLTEVGVGWNTGNGLGDYALWSRALIVNELDEPTAITILGDEVLDVYYSMRIYPPTDDVLYTVTIQDEVYDCISRAASVTASNQWYVPSGRVQFTSLPGGTAQGVFSSTIGAITGSPSGFSRYNAGWTNEAYFAASLRQDSVFSWGLDQGNVTGGIRSVYYQTSVGAYQTQFTLPTPRGDGTVTIPKDNNKVLSISFRVGWDRY